MQNQPNPLFRFLTRDESETLQVQLFRLMCATVCGLCLAVVLPLNLVQVLPIWVNIADVLLGLAGACCYWASRRGHHFFLGFFAAMVLSMNPVWFLNAGSDGSVTFYFFAVLLYPLVIFQGRMRWILAAAVVLNLGGLFVIEYFVPALVVPFASRFDRLIDLVTGVFCSGLVVAVTVRLILAMYDREQQRLSDNAAKLAASEQNYREIFNATSDALVIQDGQGRLIDVNEPMCAMYGYDRAAALRLTVDELSLGVAPYSGVEAHEKVARARAEGPQVFRWRARRCGGELFWAEVALRAGEIAGEQRVIASVRDISQRIEAEAALRTQEERLRLALDASKQGWFDLNVQTGQGRSSAEYARMIEAEPVDFDVTVGEWLEGIHPDDRHAVEAAFRECVAVGSTRVNEYRRKTRSGGWKWIRSTGKIVEYDREGKALRMLGTHADITERKELEARIQHAQRLESVATLAGGVAHDLNNILTPMLMVGSILREKLPGAEDRELLGSVESGARRGAAIVRQLMVFSRNLGQGRVPVNPALLLSEVVQFVRASFPPSIAVVEQIPVGLWSVSVDPAQLQTVLRNLCVNAREAMPLGGTLTLVAENLRRVPDASTHNPWNKGGNFVVITVTDTGRGIPPEILGRIFDPYFTTKPPGQGAGLGLSTVYGIVNGHGGTVKVESQPGIGATFRVLLPASSAAA